MSTVKENAVCEELMCAFSLQFFSSTALLQMCCTAQTAHNLLLGLVSLTQQETSEASKAFEAFRDWASEQIEVSS